MSALATVACGDGHEPSESDDSAGPSNASGDDPSNGSGFDPFAACNLHDHLGEWAGATAIDCGSLGSDASPADSTTLRDCVLAEIDTGAPFYAVWVGSFKTVGFAAHGDHEGKAIKWTFNGSGWSGRTCADVIATPDCTPSASDPCLQCVEGNDGASDSFCVYLG